jgi:hypothetical protein
MMQHFKMSDLGLLSFYLGIEVRQSSDGITLNQAAYARKILVRSGMMNCNPCPLPMETRLKLSKMSSAKPTDATEYRSIVGCLRYLVHTRPDISYAMGFVSRFMEKPTVEHMNAIKHLLRYIAGTSTFSLCYKRAIGEASMLGFSDSDHAGDIDDCKSTSGGIFFLGTSPISCQSMKQRIVAISSCEAEYVAATTAACQGPVARKVIGRSEGKRSLKLCSEDRQSICDLSMQKPYVP